MKRSVEQAPEGFSDAELSLLGYPSRTKPGRPASINLPRGNGANPELLAESIALKKAQREKVELANAKARGDLLNSTEVEAGWASIMRDLRAGLLALPTRLQQRAPHLTAHDLQLIDRDIRDLLTEMGSPDAD